MNEREPTCDRCGAPCTTGLMAAICPRREKCEFWPDDKESQDFLDSFGWREKAVGASVNAPSDTDTTKS